MKKYLSKSFVFLVVLAFILSSMPQGSFIAWAMPDDTPQNTTTVSPTETPAPTLTPTPAPSDNSTPSPEATASPTDTIAPTASPDTTSMPTDTIAPSSSPAPVSDDGTTVNAQGLVLPACVPTDDEKYDLHVKELPQLENEYTIAYQNSDGTNSLYYYQLPIKYKDKSGKYQYIDNSLVSVTDSKNTAKGFKYQNKSNNNLNILFPDDLVSDKSIRLEKGNFYFEMKPDTDIRSNTDKLSGKLFKAAGQYQGHVKSDKIDNNNLDTVDYSKSMGNDVDLEYSTTWGGLKENIVLNKYSGQNTFSFIIHTNGNPVMQPDYAMLVNDKKTGQCLAFMDNFTAQDSFSGNRVEGDGHDTQNITANIMPVDGQGNTYRLSITVDKSFLTNPNTIYPVIIDPSCTINSDEDAFEDTQISNLYAQNYAAYQDLRFGYWGSYHVVRVFTQFNLSKILGQHPGTIQSAYYHAYCPDPYNSNAIAQVYRVAGSWTTSGTDYLRWSNKPGISDFISQKLINGTTHKYWDLDITQLITNWLNNTWPNYGFCIKMSDESSSSGYTREFYSAEMSSYPPEIDITFTQDFTPPTPTITSPANSIIASGTVPIQGTVVDDAAGLGISSWQLKYALGPAMTGGTLIASGTSAVPSVTTLGNLDTSSFAAGSLYTVWLTATDIAGNTNTTSIQIIKDNTSKVGMKSYWTYFGFSTGSGTGNVNVASGNLVYQSTDFSFPSLIPMTMTRTYNSQSTIGSSLGANWNESFDIKLYTTLDGSQAIIKEGDGTLDHFTYSNGVYSAETGLFITLQKLGDNTWKATTKDNIQYSFDSSLKLYKITDLNGNYLQYAYNPNGTINTITSSANEVLSFAYYTASDNSGAWTGLLKSITLPTISTDSTQRVFNYSYNSNKQLISRSSILSDSRNWMEQFGYNASGLLSSVTDGNGNQTSLQYDVNNRVNQVNYPTVNNYTEYLQYIYNISSTSVKNQLGQGSTYYYDINGLVSKTTDALGHDTNYIYDTSKYLVTQEYYYNFINGINTLITWNYAYDSKGNLTTSIDPLGHYTCYEYNSLNEITFKHVKNTDNVTDFAETQYQYDNIGNLTTEIEPDLDKTVYTYNGFGLVATESSFPYYANAQGGYMLAPRTSVTYTYDPIHHWLIQTTKPSGLSTKTLKFDGLGNPIYLEDENGNISKTGYDSLGDDIIDYQAISGVSESNPDSANWSSDPKTSNSYDLDGNTTKSISETGLETDNYYDALNRVFKTIVDPTGKNAISTEAYSYDSNGNYIDTSTDLTTGIVNSDYYNALNQEVKSVSSDSTTTYICDNVGNRIDSSTSTVGDNVINETINKFDVLGRITDTYEDAMASDIHSTMLYDILSNVTERNDGKGSDTLSVYNNNSKLQSEILSKNGNQYTTTYLYNVSDGSGNTYNSITDDNGTQQTYFNSDGDEIKEIDALSNGTTYTTLFNNSNSSSPTEDVYVGSSNQRDLSHNQYDTSAGTNNLVLSQMPASQSVSCAYNPVNVPQTEKYESDSIDRYVYAYDVFGNLKNVKDNINSLETNYTYDGANRLSTVVEGPIGLLNPTHTYSIGYSNGNISTISESINGQSLGTNYTYYDNNNLKTTAFSYGSNSTSKTEWLYDDYNRMSTQNVYDDSTNKIFSTSILYTENSNDTSYISSVENKQVTQNGFDKTLTYGYNNNAIKSITSVWDGTNLITYSYDDRERLIRENNQGAGKTWTWEYYQDGTTHGGNIHYKREYSYTTNDDPGTPSSTITYAYNDSQGWTDLLTSYNGNAITYYSGSGNPQSDGIWTYSWEAGHNLIGLSKTGTNVSFTYNQDGIRTSKAINNITTKYTLVNGCVTSATTGTNVVYFRYDSNGSPISMETGGIEYYYFKDAQSDIIGMFDHNGNVVVQYTYDAWGKLLSETDGNGNDKMSDPNFIGNTNPYRYRGYWYDEYDYSSGFGLYYLQSRYYNPLWDRFINADTADNANDNMFSYCRNNPVTNVDPTGEGSVTTAGLYRFISIHDDLPDSTTKSYTTHYGDDCYGGDQQWYMPDKFKVSHGCGSVAAANITCYYAQYYSSLSKLYKYSTLNASDFKKHMLDVYKYVGWPWSITDVLNGLKTFGKTRGVKFGINNAGASSSATLDQSVAFIENGLNSDNPVILLTEKIYNNYDQIPQWHYMTITAIQDDTSTSTRKVTIAVSSWGLCYYFDYICLYNGTHKHGPLHYSGTGFLSRP